MEYDFYTLKIHDKFICQIRKLKTKSKIDVDKKINQIPDIRGFYYAKEYFPGYIHNYDHKHIEEFPEWIYPCLYKADIDYAIECAKTPLSDIKPDSDGSYYNTLKKYDNDCRTSIRNVKLIQDWAKKNNLDLNDKTGDNSRFHTPKIYEEFKNKIVKIKEDAEIELDQKINQIPNIQKYKDFTKEINTLYPSSPYDKKPSVRNFPKWIYPYIYVGEKKWAKYCSKYPLSWQERQCDGYGDLASLNNYEHDCDVARENVKIIEDWAKDSNINLDELD